MHTLAETITENVKFTRHYFDISGQRPTFSRLDQALTAVGEENLSLWERRCAARAIADAYATVEHCATSRAEKAEAHEYHAKWVDIQALLA